MSEYIIDYELIPLKWRDGYGLSDTELTEEIVRCRDCRHYAGREGLCMRLFNAMAVEPHGFCAWGMRRRAD